LKRLQRRERERGGAVSRANTTQRVALQRQPRTNRLNCDPAAALRRDHCYLGPASRVASGSITSLLQCFAHADRGATLSLRRVPYALRTHHRGSQNARVFLDEGRELGAPIAGLYMEQQRRSGNAAGGDESSCQLRGGGITSATDR